MYCETTNGFQIEVIPSFLPEESHPEKQYYFFTYRIRITNTSSEEAQLVSRHWVITDGNGEIHEVEGPGVVGKQPHLKPGESFEYSSFCPLPTPTGNMRGRYWMVDAGSGERFAIRIPVFFLRDLRSLH
jgi:ApaG protein